MTRARKGKRLVAYGTRSIQVLQIRRPRNGMFQNKKVSYNAATQLAVMGGASCQREGVTTDSSSLLWRAFSFLRRQTGDIRRGGVTVLLRKAGRAISPGA